MPGDETLIAAVKANDASRVRQVLEAHPELKAAVNNPLPDFSFGATPLLAAVYKRNREMIEILLQAGADINGRSLWWAGSFGVLDDAARDPEFAAYLIERGAVVDVHAAAQLGRLDRLAELLAADPALVHARGGDGQTPLHFAKTVEVAQFLLDHGADINARDVDHESTPAQYMIRERQEITRYLVARGCQSDILMAAALGDAALVRRHLEADPASIRMSVSEECFPKQDPRAGGTIYIWTLGWHKTAHQVARDFGHQEVFRLLMDRSPAALRVAISCELGDESGTDTAINIPAEDAPRLASAAQNNNTHAVRLMLKAGWPVNVRGQHGASPLHWAAWNGNAEMVEEILRYKPALEQLADPDFGTTPLQWAMHGSKHGWHRATGDCPRVVAALLKAGAIAPKETA